MDSFQKKAIELEGDDRESSGSRFSERGGPHHS